MSLLPCPFCGSTDIADEDCSTMQTNGTRLACNECGAMVEGYGGSTCTARATAKWNARTGLAWISCADRLPPDLEAVLCACTDTDDGLGPAVYAGFRANGHWISQDKNGLGDPLDNDIAFPVSHWMPLPSAPRTAPNAKDDRAAASAAPRQSPC